MTDLHARTYLMKRLREELLGPRQGPKETLPTTTDPREEYTTGVLDVATEELDQECDLELLEAEELELSGIPTEEEDEDHHPLRQAANFAPTVDPRRMPGSIGLSFLVKAAGNQRLSVCVSGGRYAKGPETWQRHSYAQEVQEISLASPRQEFTLPDMGAKLLVRVRPAGHTRFAISVFLVNLGNWQYRSKQRPSALLYQPQLRVCLDPETQLLGLQEGQARLPTSEETLFQLLYRKNPIKGRGHMCSAIWRECDLEQHPDSPFDWVDAVEGLERYRECALRTEFLPAVAVPTPSLEWRSEYGQEPQREAAELAETWDGETLARSLRPLTTAYERWWKEQEATIVGLPEAYSKIAPELARLGRECLRRMESGIRLLEDNAQARLAFCFANRAVLEQASWGSDKPLRWRPFQLGFILQCLPGLTDPEHPDRDICDLLWFPTGGGKTEAYLGLTAYSLALRRLRHEHSYGTGVISRYTLRLLAIQQFRRALKLITACELLRVRPCEGGRGWRPKELDSRKDWLWGRTRFSAGLWLGGAVTPNSLKTYGRQSLKGAFDILRGQRGEGDPAQITECPCCGTPLALPATVEGEQQSSLLLYLRLHKVDPESAPNDEDLSTAYVRVHKMKLQSLTSRVASLEIELSAEEGVLTSDRIDQWWDYVKGCFGHQCEALCSRASRPGYFIHQYQNSRGTPTDWRFEVYCPSPHCPTAKESWQEELPAPIGGDGEAGFQAVHPAFRSESDPTLGERCPIPALTVDDQIYAWPPSLIVSTVDKFARLAFEPRASVLFGNVEYYHEYEGFYREHASRLAPGKPHPPIKKKSIPHGALPPPDMILQDELHLIDGPLGSMVGLYETVVDALCGQTKKVKYIASTATVREAQDQVSSLFDRRLSQFPPSGLDADDSFFALLQPPNPLQKEGPGRLYLGYCSPGRGSLTPLIRAWATLLQAGYELEIRGLGSEELDPYWTPVGYFTAIRQLASVASIWRHYIPQRMQYRNPENCRELGAPLELSSRVSSQRLPGLLNRLEQIYPNAVDGVFATSMFGTGVDVSRLSLMVVHGQPKTTSAYIQATGRVGRQSPALVVTNYSACRPRGLDHYEFFAGYHRQLYRGVEPVTVCPFAPRARERAFGPLIAALLRQLPGLPGFWRTKEDGARAMRSRAESREVLDLLELIVSRGLAQPEMRKPEEGEMKIDLKRAVESWRRLAQEHADDLVYQEYTLDKTPESAVVLGDPQHEINGLPQAFRNTPQSLREIEPTTGFKI